MSAQLTYKHKPKLSSKAFWDVNYKSIDYNKHAEYVITKVFDIGTLDDVLEVVACYGEDKVKELILNSEALGNGAVEMAYAIFKIKPLELKCYTQKQSR